MTSSPRLCLCGCDQVLTGRKRTWASPECQKKGSRAAWILKTYSLSMEEYDQIMSEQKGVCGCCGDPFKPGQTPHIDHEHGKHIRGIVHPFCNTRLIGRLRSWERAQKLADYLRDPPAVRALGGERIAPGRPKKKRTYKRRGKKT